MSARLWTRIPERSAVRLVRWLAEDVDKVNEVTVDGVRVENVTAVTVFAHGVVLTQYRPADAAPSPEPPQ